MGSQSFITLAILLSAAQALAAPGAGGHEGIPWSELIIPQIVNVTLLVSFLVFVLRKPVRNFFSGREAAFTAAVRRAEELKQNAERAHAEIQARLKKLQETSEASKKQAMVESTALKSKMILEATDEAKKSEGDVLKNIHFEHERAVAALRSELISNSVKAAEEQVKKNSNAGVLADLQKGFTKKAIHAQKGALL